MSGNVKQFVDFSNNTNSDTGENTAASIRPITNGEGVDQTVLQRPSESLRQRTEALRNVASDSLYLRDADRGLIIAGPGKITWPGSTTALATGIPVLSDVLYIVPMLTPGSAQTAPVPPVASSFGVIHLKRTTGPSNAIAVTSMRRSYAAGDQISIVVTPGAVFSCTLDAENGYERTIKIVATGSTQLSTVITALNGLTPSAPDNTQLVNAALEGGALGTDLLLTTQAKQFMVGNYDGEGHALTPANVAAFFTANPTSALAEGDTLCIQFDTVSDTASTGGRRQAIPENSNTAVPVGSFFNSRVNPEKLINALPVCKVVNNQLIFSTGGAVEAGSTSVSIGGGDSASVSYAGGGAWADGTTNPATTVEGQLDKIITDLGSGDGAGKVRYDGGGAWADGTTNPATTVGAQLDKVISDLAPATGGAKIGGAAVGGGTILAAGTLNAQIADLATNWRKTADQLVHEGQLFFSGAQANALGPNDGGGGANRPDSFTALNDIDFCGNIVYAPFPGAGFVQPNGIARQVNFEAGPIMIIPTEPWQGLYTDFATYRIPFGLAPLTTAVGDPTNPRIDLIEVKLQYTGYEPVFSYQIKQGTPAANPTYPSPSLGYVAMAALYIPANHNTTHSLADLRDLRLPFGVRAVDINFNEMQKTGINPWVDLGGEILSTATATIDTDYVYAVCPVANATARLLGVGIHGSPGDDASFKVGVLTYPTSSAGPTFTPYANPIDNGVFGADGFTWVDATQLADLFDSTGVLKGIRQPNTPIGTPLWCNGKTCGVADTFASPSEGPKSITRLAVRFGCVGSGVSGPGGRASFVRFWVAEGL